MSVRCIIGRSGTGKTRRCIRSIAEALSADEQRPLVLLVPEQATYQAERAILSESGVRGYSRLYVLSFNRLAFMLTGKKTAESSLSRTGQDMVMAALLRRHGSELATFAASAETEGLAGELARAITELHSCCIEPGELADAAEQISTTGAAMQGRKFGDIAKIYGLYREFLEGRFANPDLELTLAKEAVRNADFLADARLWVDGFAGFTRQELELLVELVKAAGETEIALCLDPAALSGENDVTSLFYPTEATYAELAGIFRRTGIKVEEPVILEESLRFSASPALAHVEKNIFSPDAEPIEQGDNAAVSIVTASDARGEAAFAAEEIHRLVRDEGYRYRDIAVIVSDMEAYRHYIEAAFRDIGVPYFIDVPEPLADHPAARLVTAALRAATGGFSHSEVFCYLRSGFVDLPARELDILENYVVALGAGGKDWLAPEQWRHAGKAADEFEAEEIDRIRRQAVAPLRRLSERLGNAEMSATDFTAAIFEFIDLLDVRGTLAQWAGEDDRHCRFFDSLIDIFDTLCAVFGEDWLPAVEFAAILGAAFARSTLATIPPRLDQVLVGAIERSRHPDLRAALLLGVCQGRFPSPLRYDAVLTDEDRQAAEEAQLPLGEGLDVQLSARRYLAYIALTRASERLYMTRPLAEDDGSATSESEFAASLAALFTDCRERHYRPGANVLAATCRSRLADVLCASLGADRSEEADAAGLQGLPAEMEARPELADVAGLVRRAVGYDNAAKLDNVVVGELASRDLRVSATSLAAFAQCPYQYFAKHVLYLKPRAQFRLEPIDLGHFYHASLEELFNRLGGRRLAELSGREREKLVEEVVESRLSQGFLAAFRQASPHNMFIIDEAAENLRDCAAELAEAAGAGQLDYCASELSFGLDEGEKLGALEIALKDGRRAMARGKIDRLDVAGGEGTDLAFVFDYKTRERNIEWSELYHGMDLQLAIYLLAVDRRRVKGRGPLTAAGAFLFPIEVPPRSNERTGADFQRKARGIFRGDCYEKLDREPGSGSRYYNFRMSKKDGPFGWYGTSGALRAGDFDALLEFARDKIAAMAEEILSGSIDISPARHGGKSPCSFCDYRGLCRFDWQINEYRFLEKLSKEQVFEKFRSGNG